MLSDMMSKAVADGFFPYGEWAIFNGQGIIESGATKGLGGAWFDLASLTKLFTATSTLGIASEKGFSLDTTADKLLNITDEQTKDRLKTITVRSLLTHTSGLPAWYPFYADGRPFFEIIDDLPLVKQGMVYSDIGYMLLGKILCAVTTSSLQDVINRYVSEPLDIPDLCFNPQKSLPIVPSSRDNRIEENMCLEQNMSFAHFRPHFTDINGQPNDGNSFYYFKGISAHAGLFAPVSTLVRFGQFYLNTKNPVFIGAMKPQPGCMGRCLGFHVGGVFPTGCGHTGFTGTSLWIDKEADFGLVICTNRLYYDHLPQQNMNEFRLKVHTFLAQTIK